MQRASVPCNARMNYQLLPFCKTVRAIAGRGAIAQGGNDIERTAYLRENERLLAQVPNFPGASKLLVIHRPWTVRREPFGGSYIAGYSTRVLYRTPGTASVTAVSRFYARAFDGRVLHLSRKSDRYDRVVDATGEALSG